MVEPDLSVDLYDAAKSEDYSSIEAIIEDLQGRKLGDGQLEVLVGLREYCSKAGEEELAAEVEEVIENYVSSGTGSAIAAAALAGTATTTVYYNLFDPEGNMLQNTSKYLVEQSVPCLLTVSAVFGAYGAVNRVDEVRKRRKVESYEESLRSEEDFELEELLEPSS
jgi:hypothetical protein